MALLRILRRRWWILLLIPALMAGGAYALARRQTPLYRTSTVMLVQPSKAQTLLNPYAALGDPRQLADQITLIGGKALRDIVSHRLGYPASVSAGASVNADVIIITAVNSDPRRAATIANTYADAYIHYRQDTTASQDATAQSAVNDLINVYQQQLDQLDAALNSASPTQRPAVDASQTDKRSSLANLLSTERTQLAQLKANQAVDQGGAVIVSPADVPPTPFQPKALRSGALGLAVGLLLGLALVFLVDQLDNRIRGKDDLERTAGELPVVGLIPPVPGWKDPAVSRLVSIDDPTSPAAEAYRGLRTSIQFLALDRSIRTIQVTSPTSSEGKSTTLVNLAVALAKAGQRVVVVDCDLRRPRIADFFDVDPGIGFTSVLLGQIPLAEALQRIPGTDGLRILAAGPIPPNPSELLSGRRTIELFESLHGAADFVLIDSPPALPVSDAAVIATRVDATLVVVNDNATRRKQLHRTLELLHQVDAIVVGTVLNRSVQASSTYGYGYGGNYRADTPSNPRRSGRSRKQPAAASRHSGRAREGRPSENGSADVSSRQDRKVKRPVITPKSAATAISAGDVSTTESS